MGQSGNGREIKIVVKGLSAFLGQAEALKKIAALTGRPLGHVEKHISENSENNATEIIVSNRQNAKELHLYFLMEGLQSDYAEQKE